MKNDSHCGSDGLHIENGVALPPPTPRPEHPIAAALKKMAHGDSVLIDAKNKNLARYHARKMGCFIASRVTGKKGEVRIWKLRDAAVTALTDGTNGTNGTNGANGAAGV